MKINTAKMELLTAQSKMTLGELAIKSNTSRQTISTIKGRGTCATTTLVKLAEALNIDPVELIMEESI